MLPHPLYSLQGACHVATRCSNPCNVWNDRNLSFHMQAPASPVQYDVAAVPVARDVDMLAIVIGEQLFDSCGSGERRAQLEGKSRRPVESEALHVVVQTQQSGTNGHRFADEDAVLNIVQTEDSRLFRGRVEDQKSAEEIIMTTLPRHDSPHVNKTLTRDFTPSNARHQALYMVLDVSWLGRHSAMSGRLSDVGAE